MAKRAAGKTSGGRPAREVRVVPVVAGHSGRAGSSDAPSSLRSILKASPEAIEARRVTLGEGQHLFWKLFRQRLAKGGQSTNEERAAHAAEVRRAHILHLFEYADGSIPSVDRLMAQMLAIELRALDEGRDTPLLTPPKGRRGKSKTNNQRTFSVVMAVRYIRFCRGHLERLAQVDNDPLSTVAELYGVQSEDARTIKNWLSEIDECVSADSAEPMPEDLTGLADYYAALQGLLETAAMVYQREGGRSFGAIRSRANTS